MKPPAVIFHGRRDIGRKRKNNEDSLFFSNENTLGIVADGMGGLEGGEIASKMAVELLSKRIFHTAPTDVIKKGELDDYDGEDKHLLETMKRFVPLFEDWLKQTSEAIRERGKRDPTLSRMGTTISLIYAREGIGLVAHVGDSRIYRVREGRMIQVGQDHSWLNELMAHKGKEISEEFAKKYSHVITQALGVKKEIKPEIQLHRLKPGDIFCLCTDGLTDLVTDPEIETVLVNRRNDPERAVEHLIGLANARGGKDNITVLLAVVE